MFTLNANIFLRVQGFPKLGRTKKSTLASLKQADAKRAADAINDPDNPTPRSCHDVCSTIMTLFALLGFPSPRWPSFIPRVCSYVCVCVCSCVYVRVWMN